MYRCLRLFVCLLLFILYCEQGLAQAQDKQLSKDYMDQAVEILTATKAEDVARDLYVQAADTDTTNFKANFEAGHLYLVTVNKELATKYFLRIYRQNPTYRIDLEYWIGKGYQYGLQFDQAIKFFKQYKNKISKSTAGLSQGIPEVKDVDRRLAECANGKEYVADPKNYSIIHLGSGINSEYDDYGPVINEDEDEIVFTTRRRDGNSNDDVADDNLPYEEIFITKKEGKNWGSAVNIGPTINRKTNDSNLALSPDGKKLFIYHDEGNGDIYECDLQKDGTWGAPIALPDVINSSYRESSVSISKDGNSLYFASERPGGIGGSDIYIATRDSRGEWSRVKNLGPAINSAEDEESPFIDYESTALYFSSKGRKGMGGYDIFKSTLDKATNQWGEPENLGYPINTPDDDIFYIATKDGKRGYYASVREDGLGYQDIYMIIVPEANAQAKKETPAEIITPPVEEPKEEPKVETKVEAVVTEKKPEVKEPVKTPVKLEPKKEVAKKEPIKKEVKPLVKKEEPKKAEPLKYIVKVVDDATNSPLDAKIKLQGFKDNIMVGVTSPSDGVYEFNITSATAKQYRLSIEKEGYVFVNQSLNIEGTSYQAKQLTRTISLRKLAVGVSSVLRNIYFDFDMASLKIESHTELNKLEAMMRQNGNITVEIGGHTDRVGSKLANIRLSQARADAVRNFLVRKGIDPRRVKAQGYGKSKPLASNDDEKEGRELNRRVEFKVLTN